jgi:hypothetical protein
MIIFDGIVSKVGELSVLRFKNENGVIADIPMDKHIANTISLHLARISTAGSKTVERTNIENSELDE